jgi:TolB protein
MRNRLLPSPSLLHLRRIVILVVVLYGSLAAWPAGVRAQGVPDVTLGVTKTAFAKIDIFVGTLDVLSGGMAAVEAATLLESTIARDLRYSGLFRVGMLEGDAKRDTLAYEFAIRGSVEGPLRDARQIGLDAPTTVSLDLVTYPGGQLLLNKRYRPLPEQMRTTAHHFANQVVEMLTGEPGIALTRVVFSRGSGDRRDLWVVDYDGEGLMRLTANRTLNLCPAWTPDGSEIAFTSYTRGLQGLYSLDTATGQVRRIIAEQGLNLGANWHPSGRELVLSLSRTGDPEIYRVSRDGQILRRVTAMPSIEISPSWDPAGRDIVFTSDRTGTPQLYIVDGDGAGRRRLTFEGRYNDSADWSPTGEMIVYATRETDITQLVMIRPTGEERRLLTDRRWRNSEDPSWAPDGRHIVFASDRTGTFKLYVMDVVEGNVRQLTFGDEPDITPAWSRQ